MFDSLVSRFEQSKLVQLYHQFKLACDREIMSGTQMDQSASGSNCLSARDIDYSPIGVNLSMSGMAVDDTHSKMEDRKLKRVQRTQELIEALEKRNCAEQISFEACQKFIEGRTHWETADALAEEIEACAYFTRWTDYPALSAKYFQYRANSARALHSSSTDDPITVMITQISDNSVVQAARDQSLRKLLDEKMAEDSPALANMPLSVRKRFDQLKMQAGESVATSM